MKQCKNLEYVNCYLTGACKFEYIAYLINNNEEFVLKSNNEDILITSIKEFFLKENFINTVAIFKKYLDSTDIDVNKKTILECGKLFNEAYKSNETHI